MRFRYLLASALMVAAASSVGCSEGQRSSSPGRASLAIDQESNLAKLRSSPYYHASPPDQPSNTTSGPAFSMRQ